MSVTVEPALTPEEWEMAGTGEVIIRGDEPGCEIWSYGSATIGMCSQIASPAELTEIGPNKRGRQALAALALHGQPFGFTREDVEALREAFQGPFWDGFPGRDRMLSLAARIEALLPPTSTETPDERR